MIPAITSNDKFHNVIISTGNILNLNNQLGGKSTEEILYGLRLTLQCQGAAAQVELIEADGRVLRATEELNQKLTENERSEISIGAKIFLNKNSSEYIDQAIRTLLQILKVQHVDNVVLAYHAKVEDDVSQNHSNELSKTDANPNENADQLKALWSSLEQFAEQKQITQLGIADLDIEQLQRLYAAAKVKPTIAQINLESCCVVPPALKDYCTKHDIQLLTHSDPEVLLPDEQFIVPGYQVDWALRYQVHVRCRGVITAKGYILGASKQNQTDKIERV
ncbi:glutamate--cysteine ligase regulatory subunit [Anastrepha ludens]|uniref:glutamate--cysteine ligase regulatory subunit n=1 Tax=Anastrepha ludens TaxID=28586 RepID=UPI0023B1C09B|nr:glutamate--cysteine ligase regulatory subunit [Anastrepha ludens]